MSRMGEGAADASVGPAALRIASSADTLHAGLDVLAAVMFTASAALVVTSCVVLRAPVAASPVAAVSRESTSSATLMVASRSSFHRHNGPLWVSPLAAFRTSLASTRASSAHQGLPTT